MKMHQKFVVLKGAEGFGDRLECLLQAIRYAKTTRRTLVVDWRDQDWSHDRHLSFENYFALCGVAWKTLHEFKAWFLNNFDKASIYPCAWSDKVFDTEFEKYIRGDEYSLPDNSACIESISAGSREDFEETVVIYPGVGHRTFHYSDAAHIILADEVKRNILAFASDNNLEENNYDVIHLRGGTKDWAGGGISDEHPDKELHRKWKTKEQYLMEINEVHLINTGNLPKLPLYALTDTPCLVDCWNKYFANATLLPNCVHGILHDTGIHKLRDEHLQQTGDGQYYNKHIINLEAIRDFIIMTNSRSLVGDGVSLYSKMAFQLKLSNNKLLRLRIEPDLQHNSNTTSSSPKSWVF